MKPPTRPFRMWATLDLVEGGMCDCYRVREDAVFALRNSPGSKPVHVLITPILRKKRKR